MLTQFVIKISVVLCVICYSWMFPTTDTGL